MVVVFRTPHGFKHLYDQEAHTQLFLRKAPIFRRGKIIQLIFSLPTYLPTYPQAREDTLKNDVPQKRGRFLLLLMLLFVAVFMRGDQGKKSMLD